MEPRCIIGCIALEQQPLQTSFYSLYSSLQNICALQVVQQSVVHSRILQDTNIFGSQTVLVWLQSLDVSHIVMLFSNNLWSRGSYRLEFSLWNLDVSQVVSLLSSSPCRLDSYSLYSSLEILCASQVVQQSVVHSTFLQDTNIFGSRQYKYACRAQMYHIL